MRRSATETGRPRPLPPLTETLLGDPGGEVPTAPAVALLEPDAPVPDAYQGTVVGRSPYGNPMPDEIPGATHSIEIRDVYKTFGSFEVLRGLNINFVDNAITTVLGPSGTGKSVLLKHIVGLLEPDAGSISVFDRDIWSVKPQERLDMRKRFGVLFQDGALFGSMNIFDNVAFPLRKHTALSEAEIAEIVWTRLREVGLDKSADKEPGSVSGGMRKRAGFARALVLNPDIVMFDEPDSGLDPVRTSLLNDLILQMHAEHGGTYILVTHDIKTARKVSDYVGLIWKGQLVHYGLADEAFASSNAFVRQFLAGDSAGPLGMD